MELERDIRQILTDKCGGEIDAATAGILALFALSPAQAEKVPDPRPGPVNCKHVLRRAGEAYYPRTCERCRLGPCPFYNHDGTPLPAAPKVTT